MGDGTRTFSSVVWNVYSGTPVRELEPVLRRLIREGVSMFLMNEAGGADITELLWKKGLETVVYKQWRIAFDPETWELLSHRAKKTSNAVVYSKRNGPVENFFVIARFRHKPTGKKMKAISYHTPSHVQRPEWNREAPNRWQVLNDAMALLKFMASRRMSRYVLAGGDDNVDERHGSARRWRFMLRNGLRQIQAPRPTKGQRKIDDFRIKGLEPVGNGYVGDGGGDHKFFVMRFRFPRS